jgi:hypothetical protein
LNHVPASAGFAHPVFAAKKADTDTLTDFPFADTAAQRFNAANYFMPRNPRQLQPRIHSRDRRRIGMTDSARFHPNPHLARPGLSDRPFHYLKLAGCGDFHCFVRAFHLCAPFFCISFGMNV